MFSYRGEGVAGQIHMISCWAYKIANDNAYDRKGLSVVSQKGVGLSISWLTLGTTIHFQLLSSGFLHHGVAAVLIESLVPPVPKDSPSSTHRKDGNDPKKGSPACQCETTAVLGAERPPRKPKLGFKTLNLCGDHRRRKGRLVRSKSVSGLS